MRSLPRWEDAAVELGIDVVKRSIGGRPKVIAGNVSGCDVTVEYKGSRDPRSQRLTRFAVKPPTDFPFEKARSRDIGKVWSRSFQAGDPDWDKKFVVKTKNHDATRLFFTADRRALFDRMVVGSLGPKYHKNAFMFEEYSWPTSSGVVHVVRTMVRYVNELASGKLETPDV